MTQPILPTRAVGKSPVNRQTNNWFAILCLVLLRFVPVAQAEETSAKTRRVRFTYAAEVRDVPQEAREVQLWLPFPPNNDDQQISNIAVRSDTPTSVNTDADYGNQILSLAVKAPIQQPIRLELQFDVLRREHRNAVAVAGKAVTEAVARKPVAEKIDPRWLKRDALVPIDGKVLELALATTRGRESRLDQVRAIYDYTVSTLKYDKTGTGWGRGDIAFACDAKRGNCTDFHAVFIGQCRARGIPARFEIGFSLPTDQSAGPIAGYHCWASAYVAEYGWIPVDCSEAQKHSEMRDYFFGAHDENRVTFSSGRDLRLNPAQQGERLNFFVFPYAEVDGRAHDKIERKVQYENLAPKP
jgi:transglutaminase-like putative cysteine protease